MLRYAIAFGVTLLAAGSALVLWAVQSRSPDGGRPEKPAAQETWYAAYFGGVKAGHVHWKVQEVVRHKEKVFRSTLALNLTIQRSGSKVNLRAETTTEEKADGKVLALSLVQFTDGGRVAVTGHVEGKRLVVRGAGPKPTRLPWDENAIGPYRQEQIFKVRKVKPGTRFSYTTFELSLLTALTTRVQVKDYETVPVLETYKDKKTGTARVRRVSRKLLRVETQFDKVKLRGSLVQLPGQVVWLEDRMPVRYEWDFPGLGRTILYPTTEQVAKEAGVAPVLPDLLVQNTIPVKKVIDKPYDTRRAVYRITVKGDDAASAAFSRDARQEARKARGETFELHVTALRAPAKGEKGDPPGKEYLASTTFVDCDDALIKRRAERITRSEKDPWRKAQMIEKWVHDNMKGSNAIGSATASQVARDLTGDCRQHALLTTALCRAIKVPARTATGLLYVDDGGKGKPGLAYHMWTEVWVKGQWLALDATLGKGGVGACHLKIMDQSWRDGQTLAENLPVLRVLGKLSVEVMSAR
jgi:hypothetical protein